MKPNRPLGPRNKWVSLPKVARRLGVAGETALALIKSGALPGTLVGGARWFVTLDDLETYQVQIRRQHPRGAA